MAQAEQIHCETRGLDIYDNYSISATVHATTHATVHATTHATVHATCHATGHATLQWKWNK